MGKNAHRFWAETVYCKYEDHRIRQERGRRVRAQMGVFPQPRLLRFQLNRRRLYEFRLAMPVRGVQDDELYPRFGLVLPFGERPIGGVDGRGVFLPFPDKQPRRRERNAALSRRGRFGRGTFRGRSSARKTGNRRLRAAGQGDGGFLPHARRGRVFPRRAARRRAYLRRVRQTVDGVPLRAYTLSAYPRREKRIARIIIPFFPNNKEVLSRRERYCVRIR